MGNVKQESSKDDHKDDQTITPAVLQEMQEISNRASSDWLTKTMITIRQNIENQTRNSSK